MSCQTLDFWSWLDHSGNSAAANDLDDVGIGRLYVEYHQGGEAQRVPAGPELVERVERGYVHPVSQRLLAIWKQQYAMLGIRDPGLERARPLSISPDDVYRHLAEAGLTLDHRDFGGPVYLDLTDQGLPLRSLVAPEGRDNYLMSLLRDLLARLGLPEDVALLCDRELDSDYRLLERCLRQLGVSAFAVSMPRVGLPGVGTGSARKGGWEDYTVSRLTERLLPKYEQAAFRLGLRLYFLVAQGPGCTEPFRYDLLERFMKRAERILDAPIKASRDAGRARLASFAKHRGYVEPYRLASALLSPSQEGDLRPWIAELFL